MARKALGQKVFRYKGEYLIVRATKGGCTLVTGMKESSASRKRFAWGYKAVQVIAEAVVAGTMPLYVAADWFEEHGHVWESHRRKQVLRDWMYCAQQLRFFAQARAAK